MAEPVISVVPYDPSWQTRFEDEQAVLETVLAPWLEDRIYHIGSTAIPGIAAKPILDMMAGVRDLGDARASFGPLRALSYVHTPHRPNIAHHFSKRSGAFGEVTHGLHLTEPGSDLWRERLAFRDALRADRDLASEYETLKLRLAKGHPIDAVAYTAGKKEFVGRVLAASGLTFGGR